VGLLYFVVLGCVYLAAVGRLCFVAGFLVFAWNLLWVKLFIWVLFVTAVDRFLVCIGISILLRWYLKMGM
jgi:hypothetical protein